MEQFEAALADLKTKMEGRTDTEIKSAIKAFEEEMKSKFGILTIEEKAAMEKKQKTMEDDLAELKDLQKKTQDHADALDIKLKNARGLGQSFGRDEFKHAYAEAVNGIHGEIKELNSGRRTRAKLDQEVKAVGNMTVSNNLTGGAVNTYQPGVAAAPYQPINFADLVPMVQSATGLYVIYRETGSEGSISNQATPGNAKTQIDYDFTEVTYTAGYISGFARFAKQMAQDLPFLQTALPDMLRRDYYKTENAQFYSTLSSAATASSVLSGDINAAIEAIVLDIAALENLNYAPNGIVLNPADWATIALTEVSTGAGYGLPGIVTLQNGQLAINGIPIYKASWVTADTYIVGDWSLAKKVVTDGLAVEFFEQDSDNVQRNLITARIESRTCLAIDRPDAFILGDITPPAS